MTYAIRAFVPGGDIRIRAFVPGDGTFAPIPGFPLMEIEPVGPAIAELAPVVKKSPLSEAHARTLELLFRGHTVKEIARLRNRAPKTIEHTVEALKDMTGTRTTGALVHEAIAREWVSKPQRYIP